MKGGNVIKLRRLMRSNIELRQALHELWQKHPDEPRPDVLNRPPEGFDWTELEIEEVCPECGTWFVPIRKNTTYCSKTCAAKKWERKPERREYHKMHQRYRRGTITAAEFEAWKDANLRSRQS